MTMNDKEIRKQLMPYLKEEYAGDKIIQEWGTMGRVVLDIAIIGDATITGLEIKSDRDTLSRLPRQVRYYNFLCDYNYLVVSEKFISSAEDNIPVNWGILFVTEQDIIIHRHAMENKNRLLYMVNSLWRDELISILKENNIKGYSNKNCRQLSAMIIKNMSEQDIRKIVCHKLKSRINWK